MGILSKNNKFSLVMYIINITLLSSIIICVLCLFYARIGFKRLSRKLDYFLEPSYELNIANYRYELFADGTKCSEGKTVNGSKHGYWKYYWTNGKDLRESGRYINGKREGKWLYYMNGSSETTKIEGTYKNDILEGEYR